MKPALWLTAWVFLWASSAEAREPGHPVAQTSWTVEGSSPAAADAGDMLARVARNMPPLLVESSPAIRFRISSAPVLPADLTQPHQLATAHRWKPEIELRIDGLEKRLADWEASHPETSIEDREVLALHIVERQLTHALMHVVDRREGWSRQSSWTRLSGWHGPRLRRSSQVDEPVNFANIHGTKSSAEDLATLAEYFHKGTYLPGDPVLSPHCRVNSKWHFLSTRLGEAPKDTSACASMPTLAHRNESVEDIEIIYVRASTDSPASLVGHMLVSVVFSPTADGLVHREAFGLAAVPGDVDPQRPSYLLQGLTGGFDSEVTPKAYRNVMRRYTMMEDRDLYRLPMKLNDAQKERVLVRLDELQQGWHQPYLFFTRNCTQLPMEIAETVLDEDLRMPRIYGPDAVLGRLERLGLVSSAQPQWLHEIGRSRRESAATQLFLEDSKQLIGPTHSYAAELTEALAWMGSRSSTKRSLGYARLGEVTVTMAAESPEDLVYADRLMAWAEMVEQARRPPSPHGRGGVSNPLIDSIWETRSKVTAQARIAGVGLQPVDQQLTELHERIPSEHWPATTHTPLRGFGMASTWRPESPLPGVQVRRHLYRNRLGEARRYTVAPGVAASLMDWTLEIRPGGLEEARARIRTVQLQRVYGSRLVGNPGWYVQGPEIERGWPRAAQWDVSWVNAGLVLELAQAQQHRHHLLLMGGLSAHSAFYEPKLGFDLQLAELGYPLRIEGRLGGKNHPLSGVRVEGGLHLEPTAGGWSQKWSVLLEAGIRIGEIGGADYSLFSSYETQNNRWVGQEDNVSSQFTVGLKFEPY